VPDRENESAHVAPTRFPDRNAIMAAVRSRAEQISSEQQLLAGIQKYLPSTTLTIQAQPETTAQVVSVIQARVDKAQAVNTARTALHTAILASQQQDESTEAFVQGVRNTVLAMYSTSPQILGDFGLSPRKPRTPLTPEQKLVAAAKAKATRAARGTVGAKKKAAIKGTVSGSIVVPVDGSETTLVSSSSPAPSPPATVPAVPAVTNGSSSTTPHS
jgi:hypothetical protein